MRFPLRRVAFALSFAAAASGSAQQPVAPAPTPQIVTSATGESQVQPDRATILFTVETHASTAAAAGADNARRQRQVIDTLRAMGLSQDQVTTIGYSVSPEYQYGQGRAPQVTGYAARNTIRAEVRRIEQTGAVIDAALAKGANSIQSLRYYSSRSDEARREALAEAVAKARADAEVMARAAGGSLGGPLEITSSAYFPRVEADMAVPARAMSAAAPETPVAPGQQTVTASVSVRWLFVPPGR